MNDDEFEEGGPGILVVGVGGGGCNAIRHMMLQGADFSAIDSDAKELRRTLGHRLHIGWDLTGGRGSGADPGVGREAAQADRDRIADLVRGAGLLIAVAGLGAGTGGGATPIVCQTAREDGAIPVAVVTLPFAFEGLRRRRRAEDALAEVSATAQLTIVLPGSGIWELEGPGGGLAEVFARGDRAVFRAVRWLVDAASQADPAGQQALRQARGLAMIGWGVAEGPHRVREAVRRAIVCPLLGGMNLSRATSLFLTFRGASTLGNAEVATTGQMVREATGGRVPVTVGTVIDDAMGDAVEAVLIATGADDTIRLAGRGHPSVVGVSE